MKVIFRLFAFIIALLTYLLSLEPSASFWDCSEFIACASKLEIGHAPGAPVYLLLGRFFSFFAFGNSQYIALAINALSAVASALTVLLLFDIIYWFADKLQKNSAQKQVNPVSGFISTIVALVGALAYAFSDSFWFSAVEAEVYATSSLFSALVFWCIIKYEQASGGWQANRWLVLIFFLLGLSVGIHLLNLLALPAMALVVYFKHFKQSKLNFMVAIGLSLLLVVAFVFVLIPGTTKLAAFFDLFFVNTLHMPVYSGVLFFIALLIAIILLLLHHFTKTKRFLPRFAVVLCSFWLIGYSSFVVLVIRSIDNPFVDINNVENIFGLLDYLNREQYGQRPLLYGNNYNSPVVDTKKRTTYKLCNKVYEQDEQNPEYVYDANTLVFFPRMASAESRHAGAYNKWTAIKGRKVKTTAPDGSTKLLPVPTFTDNLSFFVRYQLGYMYFRYFMWNFAGRQNDIQGDGDRFFGNWISGIPLIDNWHLGLQNKAPDTFHNPRTENKYYMIPLLLGLFGLYFQMISDKKGFLVALTFFLFTGPAIVLYLNEVPVTPRERDYVHVGSFMVFAIWIGLGVAGIYHGLAHRINRNVIRWLVAIAVFVLVPGLLFYQNHDDHDRSNRYAARDFGKNMLSSCEQNALLFTSADNDTYPIWYLQQTEGFRTDVRQILTTFLAIDWYGNQLNINHIDCSDVPISFSPQKLLMRTNNYFPVMPQTDSAIDVKELTAFLKSDDKRTKLMTGNGEYLGYLPGKNYSLHVNAENFLRQSTYIQTGRHEIPQKMFFTIEKKYLSREEVLLLDILANNNWKRPVYTIYPQIFEELGLQKYLHREGMLFRLLPYENDNVLHDENVYAMHQYELLAKKFVWGNLNDPSVFVDHTIHQNAESFRFRQVFTETADRLIRLGEHEKAEQLIDLIQANLPHHQFRYSFTAAPMARIYYGCGAGEKADALVQKIYDSASQNLRHLLNGKQVNRDEMSLNVQMELYVMQELIQLCRQNNEALSTKLIAGFEQFF